MVDFEPWWEEKDLGAPPPPAVVEWRIQAEMRREVLSRWEQEYTPPAWALCLLGRDSESTHSPAAGE